MTTSKFILHDYQAVQSAEIDLNGITIIAGENGCGKSTTTRWIYYILEIISNFEMYALEDYKLELYRIIYDIDEVKRELNIYTSNDKMPNINRLRARITNLNENNPDEIAAIYLLFEELITKLSNVLQDYFESNKSVLHKQRLLSRLELSDKTIFSQGDYINTMLSKVYDSHKKYNQACLHRYNINMWSTLHKYFDDKLKIPKSIKFIEDGVNIIGNRQFGHIFGLTRCIYVDTPMALARMHDTDNIFWQKLRMLMFAKRERELTPSMKKMILRIRQIINGSIIVDPDSIDDDELRYVREDGELNIPIEETATGIKSFAYLLKLLENGLLDEKTIIIIDEPEVHLHPQWIVEFANILVELHKEIGLRILVASHNPDFVSAIHSISENQDILENVNFYLAEVDNEKKYTYKYKNLGSSIGPIFESFNIAISRIEQYGGICAGI